MKMSLSLLAILSLTVAASADYLDSDPRWKISGCFVSSEKHLLFSHFVEESKCMSRSYCHDLCVERSYRYFGLSSGRKCYCDNALRDFVLAPDNKCYWRCGGNSVEDCGSDKTILAFEITGKPAVVDPIDAGSYGPPVGCYMSNELNSALRHSALQASCMTHSFCRQNCNQRSYKYFGLRQGTKCYCGNSLHDIEKISNSKCMWKCKGNKREICGSDAAMLVFSVAKPARASKNPNGNLGGGNAASVQRAIAQNSTPKFGMLKLTSCSQSSADAALAATCGRAFDGNTNQSVISGSCFQGRVSPGGRAWWSARIVKKSNVKQVRVFNRADCCAQELANFSIQVNWVECASYNSSAPISVKMFPCDAIGNIVRITTSQQRLTLCEVQVFGSYYSL